MIKLLIFILLLTVFGLLLLHELKNAPLAEESEDGTYRFIDESEHRF
ncbi:MAG: hypothetical protein Q7J34_02715 [Bacteroidales bacterium]|nr:hypothetical protein [Bacteroidales bacterium]